ncbi:MAG TPA: hypothetical protein VKR32_06775 [Puia sp.]|nr:hypothetical protein [Puia sp.]
MPDRNFEKQVQESMEGLRFRPSDEVWKKVDQKLKESDRRRPLVFALFIVGLASLLAGYWLINDFRIVQKKNLLPPKVATSNQLVTQPIVPLASKSILPSGRSGRLALRISSVKSSKNISKSKNSTSRKLAGAGEVAGWRPQSKKIDDRQSKQFIQHDQNTSSPIAGLPISAFPMVPTADATTKASSQSSASSFVSDELEKFQVKELPCPLPTKLTDTNSLQIKSSLSIGPARKKMSVAITMGAGFSSVGKMPSRSLNFSSSQTSVAQTSSTHGDLSFYGGISVRQPLTRRILISAGLQYHYLSAKTSTGKSIDSIVFVPSSTGFNQNTLLPAVTPHNAYFIYGTTNQFINRYHFIELPILMDFKLTQSRLPICLLGGIAASYLVSADALQFDPGSGLYYKDNSVFNRIQVNLSTGLTIGVAMHKKTVEVGPEIQYGTTSLIRKSLERPQHEFYGGIRISLLQQ